MISKSLKFVQVGGASVREDGHSGYHLIFGGRDVSVFLTVREFTELFSAMKEVGAP